MGYYNGSQRNAVLKHYCERLLAKETLREDRWIPKSIYEVAEKAGLARPTWFAPYVDALEKALDEEVQLCFSAPPQHGKSTTTFCGFVYHCIKSPGRTYAYVTYNADLTKDVRDEVAYIFEKCGLVIRAAGNKLFVNGGAKVPGGSTIIFTSMMGGMTGRAIDGFIVVDDPVKNQREARSAAGAEDMYVEFWRTFMTRMQARKSMVVMMTRWMVHDLSGLLQSQAGWKYIRIPAIADAVPDPIGRSLGEVLWPERQPLDTLLQFKRNEPDSFDAMFQGEPRLAGDRKFQEPSTYDVVDPWATKVTTGVDLAYTSDRGKDSDWSTLVRMRTNPNTGKTYVELCERERVEAPEFLPTIKSHMHAGGPVKWYHGHGAEKGVGQYMVENGLHQLVLEPATQGKAQRVNNSGFRDAWNRGDILVPRANLRTPQMQAFVRECVSFTGTKADTHDDFVDAAAAAYSLVNVDSSPLKLDVNRLSAARERASSRRDRIF